MKRYLLILVPTVAVIGLIVFMARADDSKPGQLREKARQMQDLAEILRSQGKHEVAEQLAENAKRLIHEAEETDQEARRERSEESENAEQRRQDADREERPDRTEPANREERILREQRQDNPAERRMRVIREAAEHMYRAADLLREADIRELPEHLRHEAERLSNEVGQQMHAEQLHRAIGELREEVMRLRRDLEQLKQHMRESAERQ